MGSALEGISKIAMHQPINLLVFGSGKLARSLTKEIEETHSKDNKIHLVATLSKKETDDLLNGKSAIDPQKVDLVLDIAVASGIQNRVDWCCSHGINLLIGTTGWLEWQESISAAIEGRIHALYQANFAKGYSSYKEAIDQLYRSMAPVENIQIEETHSITKKDLPSGSAIEIQNSLEEICPDQNIELSSIRYHRDAQNFQNLQTLVAMHRITFSLDGEEVEIIHRTYSRSPYAKGAIASLLSFHGQIKQNTLKRQLYFALPSDIPN